MDLLSAMNREYSKSKRWFFASLLLTGILFLCSAIGSWAPLGWTKWVALAAFVLQIAIVQCRRQSSRRYRLAESVRRPAVLAAGLESYPSGIEVRKIAALLGLPVADNRLTAETYYASKSSPGPRRLLEITEECSFWTADLAKHTADFFAAAVWAAIILFIMALYAAVETGWTSGHIDLTGRVLLAVATIYFAGDAVQLKSRYKHLADAASHVTDRCVAAAAGPARDILTQALIATDEYNCALAEAPIIPEFVYALRREKLNLAWAAKCEPPRSAGDRMLPRAEQTSAS